MPQTYLSAYVRTSTGYTVLHTGLYTVPSGCTAIVLHIAPSTLYYITYRLYRTPYLTVYTVLHTVPPALYRLYRTAYRTLYTVLHTVLLPSTEVRVSDSDFFLRLGNGFAAWTDAVVHACCPCLLIGWSILGRLTG